jgi:3D (Asp-Asp-Asp) domain-containing protein
MIKKLLIIFFILLGCFLLGEAYYHFWMRTTIFVDGKRIVIHTPAATVGEILTAQNIALDPNDIVQPALETRINGRGIIHITRVTEKVEVKETTTPFSLIWHQIFTSNLRPVQLQKGTINTVTVKTVTRYHDKIEMERKEVSRRTVGTTFYRLALLDKTGTPERIYDLSRVQKMQLIATAYYPGDPLCWKDGSITCLGLKMQRGIVAVDPKVIPLRTRVYVPGYGYGYAGDTGSAIKGKRIDLGVRNKSEEKPWMHRPVTVYILENAKEW